MSYDPTKPANSSLISASELRGQFGGLKTLIDAVPVGPAGPAGEKGDSGNDGAPGIQGLPGPTGPAGNDGAPGSQGPQGLPGADGTPGPQGEKGDKGDTGDPGGPMGPQGPAGVDGRGIQTITQDGNGALTVTLSDNNTQGPFTIPNQPPAGWQWRQMDGYDASYLAFYDPNGQTSIWIQHIINAGGILHVAGLRISYDQIPTSDPGEAGRIYRDDNNFLKISAG